MQATSEAGKPNRRTFTESARRAQIVEAAIGTIAELGYRRASFARIAERAQLSSTGLISYHFAGKDELMEQVVTEVFTGVRRFMAQRVRAQSTAAAALQAYIEGNVEFIATHRTQMKALLEIFMNGRLEYDAPKDVSVLGHVQEILLRGQEGGEFRAFDTRVMAAAIQRAIDGLPFLLEADPDVDLEAYARELVTLFDLATRAAAERP